MASFKTLLVICFALLAVAFAIEEVRQKRGGFRGYRGFGYPGLGGYSGFGYSKGYGFGSGFGGLGGLGGYGGFFG